MGISESKKKIVIDNYFKRECDVNTSIKEAFTKGFELGLKKAPIPQQTEWIPISERLPENDDFVRVTIKDESGDSPYIYSDFGWYLDKAACWIIGGAEQRTDIIAWMPLPEPYKTESEK